MPDKAFVIDTNIIISVAVFSSLTPAFALRTIVSNGVLVFSEPVLQEYAETLSNNKFDKYLELAVAGKASCIITGDKDLLVLHPFENIPILTPADFLHHY